MITSATNVQIKNLVKLQKNARTRKEQNAFVTEGKKMFEEAKRLGIVKRVYVSESYCKTLEEPEEKYFQDIAYEVVDDKVFKEASDTMTPQGIMAIVEKPSYTLKDMINKKSVRLLLLEDLRDPGNLGTIMRTAEGAGMDGIIMSKETVDLFNPKVVRSTMGSIFRVPFVYEENILEVVEELKKQNFLVVATDLQGDKEYTQEDYTDRACIVIGNEAKGISSAMRQSANCLVRIPMCGELESLNASVAAGIMMYEMLRQSNKNAE